MDNIILTAIRHYQNFLVSEYAMAETMGDNEYIEAVSKTMGQLREARKKIVAGSDHRAAALAEYYGTRAGATSEPKVAPPVWEDEPTDTWFPTQNTPDSVFLEHDPEYYGEIDYFFMPTYEASKWNDKDRSEPWDRE